MPAFLLYLFVDRFIYVIMNLGLEGIGMIKKKYDFPSCTATAGRPFEDGPKCPLFIICNDHLCSDGWEQIFYNSFKTGKGDFCNTKYKKQGESEDIVSMLEISIEGTNNTCTLTAVTASYHPKNILRTVEHDSEGEIIKGLDTLLEDHILPK